MTIERGEKMKYILEELLSLLSEVDYQSSKSLGFALEVSDKTVRNYLQELHYLLQNHGAAIETKAAKGARLIVHDPELYSKFIIKNSKQVNHPQITSQAERVAYILDYLLVTEDIVLFDVLMDKLFISRTTLINDLNMLKTILANYNLKLVHTKRKGILVEGSEFALRMCIANQVISNSHNYSDNENATQIKADLEKMSTIIQTIFFEEEFSITDINYQNFLIHIYIAIDRLKNQKIIMPNQPSTKYQELEKEYLLAQKISKELEKVFEIVFPESEQFYIAIHLASKKIIGKNYAAEHNIVIPQNINTIIREMLENVKYTYNIDFLSDLELQMVLSLHLIPMEVRMKYDMNVQNPLLKDIKTRYTLAYSLAVQACEILKDNFHKNITEDEIGYIALHFNLALERKKMNIDKKNILIVCSSGRGSAELLVYYMKNHFGKYLDAIETTDVFNLGRVDFSSIDYVISTVPIPVPIPVPILEISSFLDVDDIYTIEKFLTETKQESITKYFDASLFFPDLPFTKKEDAIKFMVQEIGKVTPIPSNFYTAIMKREKQAVTEFGNFVAIPHPYKALTETTFIAIGILKKPIIWDKKKVQFIYLMSIENNTNKNLQLLYKVTSRLLINKQYIQKLLVSQTFEDLIFMLQEIERKVR